MSFNNGLERKRFNAQMERNKAEYAAAGMSDAMIEAMLDFDLKAFNSNRRYYEHTQPLYSPACDNADDKNPLFKKFIAALSDTCDDIPVESRLWWVEELDSKTLAQKVKLLSREDLELLTLYAIEHYTQVEIARALGVTKQNISLKISRLKKYLKDT